MTDDFTNINDPGAIERYLKTELQIMAELELLQGRWKNGETMTDEELQEASDKFWRIQIEAARKNGGFITFPTELIPPLPKSQYSIPDLPPAEEGRYLVTFGIGGCTLVLPGANYIPLEQNTWVWK